VESNTNLISTGTSAWAPLGVSTLSPMNQGHGTRLPFAGYVATQAAVRTADVKVPDPRGRKR
jgi:hypothetical protein